MSNDARPEPDRVEGAPHPRETACLIGQGAAERAFLDVFNSGRLHHGWLITGPRGVGKATLAWSLARFLLATPDPGADDVGLFGDTAPAPDTLAIAADHPVSRRIAAGSDPGLFHITRSFNEKTGRLRDRLSVSSTAVQQIGHGLGEVEGVCSQLGIPGELRPGSGGAQARLQIHAEARGHTRDVGELSSLIQPRLFPHRALLPARGRNARG